MHIVAWHFSMVSSSGICVNAPRLLHPPDELVNELIAATFGGATQGTQVARQIAIEG